MHANMTDKMMRNMAKAAVLMGLIALAAPLRAGDGCDAVPEVLTEAADATQIHCALSRAQAKNQSRALSIVEVEGEEAPAIAPVRFAINFESGSAKITPDSQALLAKVADVIAGDEALKGAAYFIDGHTDAVGSDASNQALGLARAQSTAGALLTGVDFAMTLKVRSFGESALLDADAPNSGRNRRVEITPVAAE